MAKTIAVDAQDCPRISQIAASSIMPAPSPPSSFGTSALIRRAFFSASMASVGNRLRSSTSRAAGPATSAPMRRAVSSRLFDMGVMVRVPSAGRGQLLDCPLDRGDALEHASLQHAVGKLDVEFSFEGEHDVDARVRGHAGLVE